MRTQPNINLNQFLLDNGQTGLDNPGLVAALDDIAQATKKIARLVRQGDLGGATGTAETSNVQGEVQKKLDIISNDIVTETLSATGNWAGLASEEMENCINLLPSQGSSPYLCVFDPLDGSSNIDINGSIGTIFSILPRPENATKISDDDFLQKGSAQIAAGFIVYGPSIVFVLTVGQGTHVFVLDENTQEYMLAHESLSVKEETKEFSVNISNYRFWAEPVKKYVQECIDGAQGPREMNFGMRYVGSMVADIYRILIKGGIFLYPWSNKEPGKPGKLRLLYEANPMSFVIEQAGAQSSTGSERIMDLQPEHLHQRCPVIMGSKNEVARVVDYHRQAS